MMTPLSVRAIVAPFLMLVIGTAVARGADREATRDTSSTLNTPPPKGAIILFDGSKQDAWLSQMDRQWERSDGPADWKVTREGWLEVIPGAGSLISKERFGNFKLHVEFRLPEGDINGGIF